MGSILIKVGLSRATLSHQMYYSNCECYKLFREYNVQSGANLLPSLPLAY